MNEIAPTQINQPPLHDAIADNNLEAVLGLLRQGFCPNSRPEGLPSPLGLATHQIFTEKGDNAVEICKALISHGANPLSEDTPISKKLILTHTEQIFMLMNHAWNMEQEKGFVWRSQDGGNLFHHLAMSCPWRASLWLKEEGARSEWVCQVRDDGATPLISSISSHITEGPLELKQIISRVPLLMRSQMNAGISISHCDKTGRDALDWIDLALDQYPELLEQLNQVNDWSSIRANAENERLEGKTVRSYGVAPRRGRL